ncbi:MAG: Spy/CpxP family protein refolding chaperone, partial [Methylococcaceae bacterium]
HYKPTDGTAPLPLLLHQINLTEKQRGEINTLVNARRAEIDAKLEEVRSIGMEIQRLSFSNDYSDSKLQMLFDKSSPIHREAALQKSRLNNAIFKLLTREQQEKLQTIMAHFKDCFI